MNTANITSRPMTPSDVDRVLEIEQANYFEPWTRQIFADCLKVGYQCQVLLNNQTIIGYSILMQVLDEAHLLNIAVDKSLQKQGIGSYFLEQLILLAKKNKCREILLEVRNSNIPARKIYEKFGFMQVGIRKNYYITAEGREDAILYTLSL